MLTVIITSEIAQFLWKLFLYEEVEKDSSWTITIAMMLKIFESKWNGITFPKKPLKNIPKIQEKEIQKLKPHTYTNRNIFDKIRPSQQLYKKRDKTAH